MFSELHLRPWVFLWTAQVEGALVERGVEPAEEGETSREGSNKVGRSTREPRLSSRAWIGKPRLPISPG